MTKSFTADLSGKSELPHGSGMRIYEGSITLAPASEAMHAKDLELHSIHAVFPTNQQMATLMYTTITNPGTANNYASFYAYKFLNGTVVSRTGSFTFRALVIGE